MKHVSSERGLTVATIDIMPTNFRLSISGMHCERCPGRVRTALGEIPGVSVKTVEIGSALIAFDSRLTTTDAVVHALGALGFPSTGEIV